MRTWPFVILRNTCIMLGVMLCMTVSLQAAIWGTPISHSAVGEPLHVDIPFDSDASGEAPVIHIATADDYAKKTMFRPEDVDVLALQVEQQGGHGLLRLRSDVPVHAPLLPVLLRIEHAGVVTFQHFSIFLSRPGIAPIPRVAVASVQAKSNAPLPSNRYGPVALGESLSLLQRRLHHDANTSAAQFMAALFEKNPHAFQQQNIHRLKAGVMLSLPSAQDMAAISDADANRVLYAEHAAESAIPTRITLSPVHASAQGVSTLADSVSSDDAQTPNVLVRLQQENALLRDDLKKQAEHHADVIAQLEQAQQRSMLQIQALQTQLQHMQTDQAAIMGQSVTSQVLAAWDEYRLIWQLLALAALIAVFLFVRRTALFSRPDQSSSSPLPQRRVRQPSKPKNLAQQALKHGVVHVDASVLSSERNLQDDVWDYLHIGLLLEAQETAHQLSLAEQGLDTYISWWQAARDDAARDWLGSLVQAHLSDDAIAQWNRLRHEYDADDVPVVDTKAQDDGLDFPTSRTSA